MGQSLRKHAILPNLPFVDREEHLGHIRKLFEDQSEKAVNIALMDGEGGLGKTEVVIRAAAAVPDSCLVVWLPSTHHDGNHKDIIENAFTAILNKLGKETEFGKEENLKNSRIRVFQDLLPNILQDIKKIIGVRSETISHIGQVFISHVLKKYNVDKFTPRGRFNDLMKKIWANGIKVIFIVEDIHLLSRLEGRQLITLINSLDGIDSSQSKWLVLMTSHPIRTNLKKPNALSELWPLLNRWSSDSWTIDSLEGPHMASLAEKYIANNEVSSPVIKASKGNPRRFFEVIQKLALRGQCSVQKSKVRLLGDVNELVVLDKTFEQVLINDIIMRHMCGALAVGAEKVPLRVLSAVGENCDPTKKEYFDRINLLQELSYTIHCDNDNGDSCIRLLDDNKSNMVRRVMQSFPIDTYQIHHVLADAYLQSFSKGTLELLIAMGSPETKVDREAVSTPRISYFLQASIHAVASNYPDAHLLAVSSLRILDFLSRFAELVRHYQFIVGSIDKFFHEEDDIRVCIQSLLSKAYYHLGDFNNCVEAMSWPQLLKTKQSETLYYHAVSIVVAKKDPTPSDKIKEIVDRVSSPKFSDKSWEPQIITAYAFSFQEYGKYLKSIIVYLKYYFGASFSCRGRGWHTFAMMSPLFLPIPLARISCQKAYTYFNTIGNMRLAGMALHNLGYCDLRAKNLDQAYKLFSDAEKILSENAEEEAGFPKINKAFIHLVRGEGLQAKALSSDTLKLFRSPFYISAARVNLAIADWQLGAKNAVEHLDQIPQTHGLMNDPNQVWRIAFNRAFILLNTADIVPSQSMVDGLYNQLGTGTQITGMAEFWNNMVAELAPVYPEINWPKVLQSHGKNRLFINTKLAPFRASTLCFGHA